MSKTSKFDVVFYEEKLENAREEYEVAEKCYNQALEDGDDVLANRLAIELRVAFSTYMNLMADN